MTNIDEMIEIRPAMTDDLGKITRMNNDSSNWLGKKKSDFFKERLNLITVADTTYSAPICDLAGFALVMDEKINYDSVHFNWFRERFPQFKYIDRVIVDLNLRGYGVGSALYNSLFQVTPRQIPIVCEISINPANEESIRFHERHGFRKIGEQRIEVPGWFRSSKKTYGMYVKNVNLC